MPRTFCRFFSNKFYPIGRAVQQNKNLGQIFSRELLGGVNAMAMLH